MNRKFFLDWFRRSELTHVKPTWYTLESKRKPTRKKDSTVSGEILLQFSLVDTSNPIAPAHDTYRRFQNLVCFGEEEDDLSQGTPQYLDDVDREDETTDDADEPEVAEKRRRKLRLRRLKRKTLAARAYQFSDRKSVV